MKILLIEDNPANIQSARDQFDGHDLTIATTFAELMEERFNICKGQFDLVLTDNHIPIGEGRWDVCNNPTKDCEVGAMVLALCLSLGIPCLMLSDGNGHRDTTSLFFEQIPGDFSKKIGPKTELIRSSARSRANEPKDWKSYIPSSVK